MKLYHGTSAASLAKINRSGIKPRNNRKSLWDQSPSCDDRVYLTNAYPLHFAINASMKTKTDAVILQVDSTKLSYLDLVADEDYLFELFKDFGDYIETNVPANDTKGQLQYFGNKARELGMFNPEFDGFSYLKRLGTCAYIGTIPKEAITKIVSLNVRAVTELVVSCYDPTISTANYKYCGNRYRWITALIMGEEPDPKDAPTKYPEALRKDNIFIPEYEYPMELWDSVKQGIRVLYEVSK
jgi:hypothetical protein